MNFLEIIKKASSYSTLKSFDWTSLMTDFFKISKDDFLGVFMSTRDHLIYSDRALLMICLKQQAELNEVFNRIKKLEDRTFNKTSIDISNLEKIEPAPIRESHQPLTGVIFPAGEFSDRARPRIMHPLEPSEAELENGPSILIDDTLCPRCKKPWATSGCNHTPF